MEWRLWPFKSSVDPWMKRSHSLKKNKARTADQCRRRLARPLTDFALEPMAEAAGGSPHLLWSKLFIEKNPQSSFEVRRCGRCRGRHLRRAQFFFYALPRNFTCQVSPAFIFYHFIKQRTCVGWLSCTLLHKIASSRFAAGTEESCYGDERHFLKIKRNVFVPCSRILSAFAERRPPPPSAAAARAAC